MTPMHWFAGISLGLLANGMAEIVLSFDLHQPWRQMDSVCRHRRVVRWVVCILGHALLVMAGASFSTLSLFALFSISAATDFESCLLPPDWMLFGSVISAMALAAITGGWPAFRDVAVAQAFCFAIVTLGVAFLNLCDSGDIKLAMQFGALCGSLSVVAASALGIWLVAIVSVLVSVLHGALHMPVKQSIQLALRRRPPQGPLMWCGFLLAFWMLKGILP